MSLIAVDMTPVLPGGENGGAKILALELLKSFQEMDRLFLICLDKVIPFTYSPLYLTRGFQPVTNNLYCLTYFN